jgi:hypothetical protein
LTCGWGEYPFCNQADGISNYWYSSISAFRTITNIDGTLDLPMSHSQMDGHESEDKEIWVGEDDIDEEAIEEFECVMDEDDKPTLTRDSAADIGWDMDEVINAEAADEDEEFEDDTGGDNSDLSDVD